MEQTGAKLLGILASDNPYAILRPFGGTDAELRGTLLYPRIHPLVLPTLKAHHLLPTLFSITFIPTQPLRRFGLHLEVPSSTLTLPGLR